MAFGRESPDESSLDELAALATSAGFDPVARIVVRRQRADAALFVGAGKADEIAAMITEHAAETVIFDNVLGAVPQRNLGRRWSLPVQDRTELILEIFARRAVSREGKLQVELARLEHLSARLVRGWTHLERQRGGIGVRGGPGEKQIELDRRMLSTRVKQLRGRLRTLERQRQTRRRDRSRGGAFTVSLVGYTNAGKSTLFNRLTGETAYAADKLFATLDTLTRRIRLSDPVRGTARECLLSDTVGFVRDLPHQLVEAFRATLEETAAADLLLHVVDSAAPDRDEQIEQVQRVLAEIGADRVPQMMVFNKVDRGGLAPGVERDPCGNIHSVRLSATTGAGVDGLRQALVERIEAAERSAATPGPDSAIAEAIPPSADTLRRVS